MIVVIAILAAITIVAYTGIRERSEQSALQSTASQAAKSLEAFRVSSAAEIYPNTLAEANLNVGTTYTPIYSSGSRQIDDVGVYSRPLSAAEVAEMYQAGAY